MKLYLEIDTRPYLRMWKSKGNGTWNKKVMKKFYELFAQPSYFIQQYHFRCYFISLYDVKSSFQDFTFIVAAILDFSAAILKIDQFWLANERNSNNSCQWTFLPSFMLVSGCAWLLSFPAPLIA